MLQNLVEFGVKLLNTEIRIQIHVVFQVEIQTTRFSGHDHFVKVAHRLFPVVQKEVSGSKEQISFKNQEFSRSFKKFYENLRENIPFFGF